MTGNRESELVDCDFDQSLPPFLGQRATESSKKLKKPAAAMRLANCSTQSSFVRQDCFTRNPTMTTTYPFSVSSNNFEGKRVLVTGGTRGIAETMVCRFTPGTDSVATVSA